MRLHSRKSWMVVVLCGIHGFSAYSATSLFSDYGQIQNVQNYSSNPFWNPNSPYNQKLPQPVYVQGAALNSEDCMKAVYYLVSVQCMARNNCQNTSLSDIRPEIMVQLSKLPGANYVSSCSGYIDTAYNSYVEQYKTTSVKFPDAPVSQQVNIQNPYKQKPSKQQQEIIDRKKELQELQKQNGAGSEHLSATEFPMTYDDLSFTAKTQLMTDGYAPFKDKKAYAIPDFISKQKWCAGEGKGSKECEEPKKETTTSSCNSNSCTTSVAETVTTEDPIILSSALCATGKTFDLSTEASSLFKAGGKVPVKVSGANTGKIITEELIKCSTTPTYTVPSSNYSRTTREDDYIYVYDPQSNTKKYEVQFDSITDHAGKDSIKNMFKALCTIANGSFTEIAGFASTLTCSNIKSSQFNIIKTLVNLHYTTLKAIDTSLINNPPELRYTNDAGVMLFPSSIIRDETLKTAEQEEPDEELIASSNLCSDSKIFDLSTEASSLFKAGGTLPIKVRGVYTGKMITEELIKCSTTPTYTVPSSNYSRTTREDDYIYVYDPQSNTKKYEVQFDSITDGNSKNSLKNTFKALCFIANGSFSETTGIDLTLRCNNIKALQFSVIKELINKHVKDLKDVDDTFKPDLEITYFNEAGNIKIKSAISSEKG